MIRPNFPQLEGRLMYHYTSEEAVLGIIKQDMIVLQPTKADCLDDTTEGKEIYEHLQAACNELFAAGAITQEQYQQIIELKDIEKHSLVYPSWLHNNKTDICSAAFKECVAYEMSFCKVVDDEGMWEDYAHQQCCLHFNMDSLSQWFPQNIDCSMEIREITYYDVEKVKEIKELILDSITSEDYLQKIEDGINYNCYFYKGKEEFSGEKEIRFLCVVPKNPTQTTYIEKVEPGRKPYIEVEISSIHELFVIRGVTIAKNADYKRVKQYLATCNPHIEVFRKGEN